MCRVYIATRTVKPFHRQGRIFATAWDTAKVADLRPDHVTLLL